MPIARQAALMITLLSVACAATLLLGQSSAEDGPAAAEAPRRQIIGSVRSPGGLGVGGLPVRADGIATEAGSAPPWGVSVATTEGGAFTINAIPERYSHLLVAIDTEESEYCDVESLWLRVGDRAVDVVLREATGLSGRVDWAELETRPDVRSMVVAAYWDRQSAADLGFYLIPIEADGSWECARVPREVALRVGVQGVGERRSSPTFVVDPVKAKAGQKEVRLRAHRGLSVRGALRLSGNQQVPEGCSVWLYAEPPIMAILSEERGPIRLEPGGGFEFECLHSGTYKAVARLPEPIPDEDGRAYWSGLVSIVAGVQPGSRELVLDPAQWSRGKVSVRVRGQPGERIDLEVSADGVLGCYALGHVIPASGCWVGALDVPDRKTRWGVRATGSSGALAAKWIDLVGDDVVDLELQPPEHMNVQILRDSPERVRVEASACGFKYQASLSTPSGEYRLAGLPRGEYELQAFRMRVAGVPLDRWVPQASWAVGKPTTGVAGGPVVTLDLRRQ